MVKDDGGVAFPSGRRTYARRDPNAPGSGLVIESAEGPLYPGMSVRDYFAAKAMQSLLVSLPDLTSQNLIELDRREMHTQLAYQAFQIADAMIKARPE